MLCYDEVLFFVLFLFFSFFFFKKNSGCVESERLLSEDVETKALTVEFYMPGSLSCEPLTKVPEMT